MAKRLVDETSLATVANAIREKTGESDPLVFPEEFVTAIEGISTGGGGGSGGGSDDFEWFNDGNTHIWISLQEGRTSPMLGVCPNGTVTVDWGDGSAPDILTGSSTTYTNVKWTPKHNYASAGNYVITLTVDGQMVIAGKADTNNHSYLLRDNKSTAPANMYYLGCIQQVEIGEGVTVISYYAFMRCYNLKNIAVPEGVGSIFSNAFNDCHSLLDVTIPERVTKLESNAFTGCYKLTRLVIPEAVTNIAANVFKNCGGLLYIDFTACSAVPSLGATSAFDGIPSDCQIRVPAALYDEWIAATNWSSLAGKIVAV